MATMGVMSDAGLVPNPERIIEAFEPELESLAREAARAGGRVGPTRYRSLFDRILPSARGFGCGRVWWSASQERHRELSRHL